MSITRAAGIDPARLARQSAPAEIAFIDPGVADIDVLLCGLQPGVEGVLLNDQHPAPRQMARPLAGRQHVATIHVIAHGRPGEVSFGAGALSLASLPDHAADLATIGRALGYDGKLLLWTCETAAGVRGGAFVDAVAHGVDGRVAASTNRVGAAAQGGSWELDTGVGAVHLRVPLSARSVANYAGVMATYTTTTGTDTIPGTAGGDTVNVATGTINSGDGINGGGGTDTIVLTTTGETVDFSVATVSSIEALTGTSGTDSITLSGTQLDAILISAGTIDLGAGTGDTISLTSTSAELNMLGAGADAGIAGVEAISASTAAAGVTTTLSGRSEAFTVTGSAHADAITGGAGADAIVRGAGADTLTGGAGSDTFNFAAGDSALSFGGSGTSGTISGYDVITDFAPGRSAATSEKIGFTGVAVAANTTGVNGTNSSLQLHTGNTVSSHAITSGIITFDDASTFGSAVALTSTADVAAVAQYLQANDLGSAGVSVAFTATISGVSHTCIYIQSHNATSSNANVLIDLEDVSATSISATGGQLSVLDNAAPAAVATVTALSTDSGTAADFITNTAAQTVSGTFTGTLGSGETIQVSADGGTTWIAATAGSGTWSATGVTLAAGTGSPTVRTIDNAGNVVAGTGHSYTLDRQRQRRERYRDRQRNPERRGGQCGHQLRRDDLLLPWHIDRDPPPGFGRSKLWRLATSC